MYRLFQAFSAALLLMVSLFGFVNETQAQLEVETGLTLEEYVNDILLGSGIQASNITYQGGTNQLGGTPLLVFIPACVAAHAGRRHR